MNVLRYSWIALITAASALAEESPGEEKTAPVPPPPQGEEDPGKPPAGPKGPRGEGKDRDGKDRDGFRRMIEAWKKADTDGDGFISTTEFAAMERPGRLPEEKRAEIFSRFDKNSDGRIGPEEMPKKRPGGMPPLEQVDADKDGKIIFAEFQKLGFVERLPLERQQAMFKRMDTDGDGSLTPKDRPPRDGKRDGDGRRDGKGGAGRRSNLLEMVKDHDKNGDGALSFEEFRQVPSVKRDGEDQQEDRFEELDRNKDLKLDASDFLAPEKPKEPKEPKAPEEAKPDA